MLKKSASGVLASLRGSPYRSVRLASSLAAALLDSRFEHPEDPPVLSAVRVIPARLLASTEFFRSLLVRKRNLGHIMCPLQPLEPPWGDGPY
jgi:hypothetical protein